MGLTIGVTIREGRVSAMTARARVHALDVDERRAALLELRPRAVHPHPYDELSMAAIAREAGISKALLYHYFPSKQAYFVATMQEAAQQLADRVRPGRAAPAAPSSSPAR